MADKEQIKCNYKFQDKERFDGRPYCTCFDRLCEDLFFICDHNCQVYEDLKQLARKTQECEELKIKLMQKDEVNTFFNTPIEGWSSNPCDICESKNNYEQLKQECEELKKELVTYKKLLNNPESIVALTDVRTGEREVWRKLGSKADRYRKALEEIEKVINNILNSCLGRNTVGCRPAHNVCGDLINILDIINKAKGEGKCQ